jgi:hypothetical protein
MRANLYELDQFSGIIKSGTVYILQITCETSSHQNMNTQELALYERIQQFSLDGIDVRFPFSQKLAKENNWTVEYTQRVICEYKKFIFLAVVAGHTVTPSEQVDQVWHLHLIYTHSYWQDFCPNILQMDLHHSPTNGGQEEEYKYRNFYSKTLTSYEHFFQQQPPLDIWSNCDVRFEKDTHNSRVNTDENWVIAKPNFSLLNSFLNNFNIPWQLYWMFSFLVIIGITTWELPASASLPSPINRSLPDFFTFYSSLGIMGGLCIAIVGFFVQRITNIAGIIPFLSANLALTLFSLGSFNLVTGISSIVGFEFLGFYILSASSLILFNFAIARWRTPLYVSPSKYKLSISQNSHLKNIGIALGLFFTFGLYSLGITRIIIGIYRHKPVRYLAILSLAVGLYFLWYFNNYQSKLNPFIKNIISRVVILSAIPLLILGFQGAAWLMFVLLFIFVVFWSSMNTTYSPISTNRNTTYSNNYNNSSNGTCSGGDSGGDSGGSSCGGGGGCGGGCGG